MFEAGFRLEFKLRILDDVDLTVDLLPEGKYQLRIEDARLWTTKGRLSALDGKKPMVVSDYSSVRQPF